MNEVSANELVKIFVLPGGKMPEQMTKGAVGFDVFARNLASPNMMDPLDPKFRTVLFDFKTMPRDITAEEADVRENVVKKEDGTLAFLLKPGKRVLVGIGFCTEMVYPMFYWMSPRSGLASKWGITIGNSPGTIDPDYRGEAGAVLINTGDRPFEIAHNMRIAQIIFQRAIIPKLVEVKHHRDLAESGRGSGGFGSTGLRS
jgi:dUTP pyrophosphatase